MRTATNFCPRFPFKMAEQIDLLEFGRCGNCYPSCQCFWKFWIKPLSVLPVVRLCFSFLHQCWMLLLLLQSLCNSLSNCLFNFRITVPNFPLCQQNHSRGGSRWLLWQQHQTHSRRGGLQPLPMPCFVRHFISVKWNKPISLRSCTSQRLF